MSTRTRIRVHVGAALVHVIIAVACIVWGGWPITTAVNALAAVLHVASVVYVRRSVRRYEADLRIWRAFE